MEVTSCCLYPTVLVLIAALWLFTTRRKSLHLLAAHSVTESRQVGRVSHQLGARHLTLSLVCLVSMILILL